MHDMYAIRKWFHRPITLYEGFPWKTPRPWFNIKMSYQYRKSHCGDKTVVRSSYLHNGICYTGTMTSLYWIRAQASHKLTLYLWSLKTYLMIHQYVNRDPYTQKLIMILCWCGALKIEGIWYTRKFVIYSVYSHDMLNTCHLLKYMWQ